MRKIDPTWFYFSETSNPLECGMVIHRDVINLERVKDADVKMLDHIAACGVKVFGPKSCAWYAFEDLHSEVNDVWLLVDADFITWEGASKIFDKQLNKRSVS